MSDSASMRAYLQVCTGASTGVDLKVEVDSFSFADVREAWLKLVDATSNLRLRRGEPIGVHGDVSSIQILALQVGAHMAYRHVGQPLVMKGKIVADFARIPEVCRAGRLPMPSHVPFAPGSRLYGNANAIADGMGAMLRLLESSRDIGRKLKDTMVFRRKDVEGLDPPICMALGWHLGFWFVQRRIGLLLENGKVLIVSDVGSLVGGLL